MARVTNCYQYRCVHNTHDGEFCTCSLDEIMIDQDGECANFEEQQDTEDENGGNDWCNKHHLWCDDVVAIIEDENECNRDCGNCEEHERTTF